MFELGFVILIGLAVVSVVALILGLLGFVFELALAPIALLGGLLKLVVGLLVIPLVLLVVVPVVVTVLGVAAAVMLPLLILGGLCWVGFAMLGFVFV